MEWSCNFRPDEGYDGAHIIGVLTESVPDAFLAHSGQGCFLYLRRKTELELALVLKAKICSALKLLLEGGGNVNGSFLQEELIDEISLVVIPAAECSENAIPLFKTGKYGTKLHQQSPFI